MNEEEFEQFKTVWESYGGKFQNDDGTYRPLYDVFCEMSSVWQRLNEENRNEILQKKIYRP